ncbi:MAG: hypothetical protein ABEJ95_07740 [Candidatus Nanohalobium sp.]
MKEAAEGDINQVYIEENTVRKIYSHISSLILLVTLIRFTYLQLTPLSASRRIKNERKVREKDLELNFPEILSRNGREVRFRKINGETLDNILENRPFETGHRMASTMKELESQNVYLIDYNPHNFIQAEDGLYCIDAEFTEFRDTPLNRLMDRLSVITFVSLKEQETRDRFIQGFREETGSLSPATETIAGAAGIVYASIYIRDPVKLRKAAIYTFKSLKTIITRKEG